MDINKSTFEDQINEMLDKVLIEDSEEEKSRSNKDEFNEEEILSSKSNISIIKEESIQKEFEDQGLDFFKEFRKKRMNIHL